MSSGSRAWLSLAVPSVGLSEDVVLIRAMRDSNVPKFLRDDLPLFHAIVGDLFPGVVVPKQETGDLEQCVPRLIMNCYLSASTFYAVSYICCACLPHSALFCA
jgi:hypothetical protein